MFLQRLKIFYFSLTFGTSLVMFFNENPFKLFKSESKNEISCGRYPNEKDLKIDNLVWQNFSLPNVACNLFNAYFDDRENATIVRILLLSEGLNISTDTIYCQFWLDDDDNVKQVPIVVKATKYVKIWPSYYNAEKGHKLPYLLTCPIDFKNRIPASVSLTSKACEDASNKLKIINNQPVNGLKEKFGVCNKYIYYNDRRDIIKFIEWMTIVQILGANKVRLLKRLVHPEFLEIMEYYVKKGFLEYDEFREPTGCKSKLDPTYNRFADKYWATQMEILETVAHTDCFYKSRNLYEYILDFDCDEVIIPTNSEDYTWHDLVKRFNFSEGFDSFLPRNLIMPNMNLPLHPDIPDYHYMLQHTRRAIHTNDWVKQIFIPDRVVSVYIHTLMFCLSPIGDDIWCSQQNHVPEDWAITYHFRDSYNPQVQRDNNTTPDTTLWKYKDHLIREVKRTLLETGFSP